MNDIRIGTRQGPGRSGTWTRAKPVNLGKTRRLARECAADGMEPVALHEPCATGCMFHLDLNKASMSESTESFPDGPSTRMLFETASASGPLAMARFGEKNAPGNLRNTYLTAVPEDFVTILQKSTHSFHDISVGITRHVTAASFPTGRISHD